MFDQSTVASVNAPVFSGAGQVFVSWVPTASGLTWQVYLNAELAYAGGKTGVWLPVPSGGVARCDIGSVDPSEINDNFAADLPSAPARRVQLTWTAGTDTAPDLDHFAVFGEATPGGGIDYSTPLATISAFAGGDPVASGSYSWVSSPLYSGTWSFCVVGYDTAGNEGTRDTRSAVVAVPPGPPSSLAYVYHASGLDPTVTLTWSAASHP